MLNRIFSTDSPKAIKARGFGFLNAIHYMAPFTLGGVGNLCPHASAGCMSLCLGEHSGQAGMVSNDADMNAVRLSRRAKAQRFMRQRAAYMADVVRSIELAERDAIRKFLMLCVRMNGSTDIAWESIKCIRNGVEYPNLMAAFPHLQFIDYTKNPKRMTRNLPINYHLTFSRSETNESTAVDLLRAGHNVAVVFARGLPQHYRGFPVVNGDEHDLRHVDPRAADGEHGFVIGLSPKGRKAKRDRSGFVVHTWQQ